jgi:transcriptional regulator with XRE-family HTH domain
MTESEIVATLIHLRSLLDSGRAQAVCRKAGLTNADVAKVIGVSAPSVWCYFNAGRRPRRATALRLARLIEQVSVIRDA